jgi:hypothetical protein
MNGWVVLNEGLYVGDEMVNDGEWEVMSGDVVEMSWWLMLIEVWRVT